jgi:hypothetical protein
MRPGQDEAHAQRGRDGDAGAGSKRDQHRSGEALVEMVAHLWRDGAERHADVGVEHPRGNRQGNDPKGQRAGDDHQHLREQQLGAEAPP